MVRDTTESSVSLAEASVCFMTEGNIGDPRAKSCQVGPVCADLHQEVLAEVHSLVAAAAQVHDSAAASERGGRGEGGGLGAGLGRARTSGQRRAVRLHHHWRGAASAAGARASPHHAPAQLALYSSGLFLDDWLHLYFYS